MSYEYRLFMVQEAKEWTFMHLASEPLRDGAVVEVERPGSYRPHTFHGRRGRLDEKNGATLWLRGGLIGGHEAFDFGGLIVP